MLTPGPFSLVPFVSVENMIRIIYSTGVAQFLKSLASYIEQDFKRWDKFDKTPRIASHYVEGVIELMPTSDNFSYGFKYVNGHPKNTKEGRQTVTAFGVLSEVDNGYPVLITEMTILTALRTAATSALVAKHLAPKGSKKMAVIGNGAQCEFQCLAFKEICGLDDINLYDIDKNATQKVMYNLRNSNLNLTPCASSEEAMEGASIITTCTADKKNATILTDNMVGSGVHINAIGGDCPGKTELHKDILLRSDIFVEYAPQSRIEGEIQQLDANHPITELHEVFKGEKPGRKSNDQITLFDSVGFAVEDFSALRYIRDMIKNKDFFVELDLLADPDNPKDLFGMLERSFVELEKQPGDPQS